jgi:hypothetical protein
MPAPWRPVGIDPDLPFNGGTYSPTPGEHTYMLTATLGGLSQSYTETIDFAGLEPTLPGDINRDNKVDLTDFGILKANFGKGADTNVPEPSTWLLATLAALGWVTLRRRR